MLQDSVDGPKEKKQNISNGMIYILKLKIEKSFFKSMRFWFKWCDMVSGSIRNKSEKITFKNMIYGKNLSGMKWSEKVFRFSDFFIFQK